MTVLHPTGKMWNASGPAREHSSPGLLLQPEAREHRLETCRNDLDVCPWLEAKKNGPQKGQGEGEAWRDTCKGGGDRCGIPGRAWAGGKSCLGCWAGKGLPLRSVKVGKPFLESCHPSSCPCSAGRQKALEEWL